MRKLGFSDGKPEDGSDDKISAAELFAAGIKHQLDKIRELRSRIDASGRPIDLEVDGGINVQTAPQAIAAGADLIVAGTATFTGGPAAYADNIDTLRSGTHPAAQ